MRPLTEHDIRASFVNCTKGEVKRLSVPRDLAGGRIGYVDATGLGGFFAIRYQGERPFNRRNTFFADAYTEYDAGVSYDHARWRFAVVGRNLGDDRHVVTESEIGDAQFYIAPPRRFSAEVGYRF